MIGIRNQILCPDFKELFAILDDDEAVGHVVGEDLPAVSAGREDPSVLSVDGDDGVEVSFPVEKLEAAVNAIIAASEHIDSVFSLDVVTKLCDNGSNPAKEILDRAGIFYRPNCKTNVGLGKPAYQF